MKYLKLYEQEEWWLNAKGDGDTFKYEEIKMPDLLKKIKKYLIDNPRISEATRFFNNFPQYRRTMIDESNKFFVIRSEWSMLYDNINYDKLKIGSVILCNIPGTERPIGRHKIVKMPSPEQHFGIQIDDGFGIHYYNIKEVIDY